MSGSEKQWAVYLDYGQEGDKLGIVYSMVLGGSIGSSFDGAGDYLRRMADRSRGYDELRDMWEVDEDDLPYGYTFQTYYAAGYYGKDVAK